MTTSAPDDHHAVRAAWIRRAVRKGAGTGGQREVAARAFILLGLVLLPLQAAGTIELVFTLTPSYAAFGVALALGPRLIARGLRAAPKGVAIAILALLVVYITTTVFGDYVTVEGQARGGATRALVYTGYVFLGAGFVCLVVGVADATFLRQALGAVVLGGTLAAVYGIWTWFALHYDLPLSDVNNAVNSDGSYGHKSQGAGLFGWERVRGPFTEPIGFGGYLAVPILFLPALFAEPSKWRWWRSVTLAAGALMLTALALTVSSISAAGLLLGLLTAVLLWAVSRSALRMIAVTTVVLVTTAYIVGVLLFHPAPLAAVTGRTTASLQVTLSDRTSAWSEAGIIWATRPVAGYGPGQAAARMARRQQAWERKAPRNILPSAQGIVTSSLVDTGLIGLFALATLFGAALWTAVSAARAGASLAVASGAGATVAGVFVSALNGDRVDLRVWVAVALLLAATHACGERDRGAAHHSS